MSKPWAATILAALLAAATLVLSACAPRVSQADYNQLRDEFDRVSGQLAQAQAALVSQNATSSEVVSSEQYQDLNGRYTALEINFQTLQAQQARLTQAYDQLKQAYDALTATNISTGEAEQMIFTMINQERVRNGLGELALGKNLYDYAMTNDQEMAATKTLKNSTYPAWQDVWWTTGYHNSGEMANAVTTIWKNGAHYQQNFLNLVADYGAVAVYQSGDIYYITFMAGQFP